MSRHPALKNNWQARNDLNDQISTRRQHLVQQTMRLTKLPRHQIFGNYSLSNFVGYHSDRLRSLRKSLDKRTRNLTGVAIRDNVVCKPKRGAIDKDRNRRVKIADRTIDIHRCLDGIPMGAAQRAVTIDLGAHLTVVRLGGREINGTTGLGQHKRLSKGGLTRICAAKHKRERRKGHKMAFFDPVGRPLRTKDSRNS